VALTAIVLAGGPRDAVAQLAPGALNKAFVPVAGVPLVARTIAGLRASAHVGRIIAVAPDAARALPALEGADSFRRDGARISDSLRSGLFGLPRDPLVLVCASDLPVLSGAAVDEFAELALASGADIVYACVERATHAVRYPQIPHTWATFRDGTFCGGGLAALRPRLFDSLERFLEHLGRARKNPAALAALFGYDVLALYALRLLSIAAAERRATRLLGAQAAAAICSFPEIAVNVDRPGDVALAEALIASA
jgi:molybdopterin-guanine dinucleotide biosynthesis protein A